MKRSAWSVLLLVVVAGSAEAQTRPCAVTIVRAPDDVKTTVESWLAKEPCATPLVVRIIPTEGQLYIYAQDERGRVRERVVPDAESAGVLIASWTADDGIAIAEPAPIVAPIIAAEPVRETQHDLVAVFRPTAERARTPLAPPADHWLTLAVGAGSGAGLRAEVEALRRGAFTADLQIGWGRSAMNDLDDPQSSGIYIARFEDLSGAVAAHYTWPFAKKWHLRGGLGAGVVGSQLSLEYFDPNTGSTASANASLVSAFAEASLLVGYSFADHWQVELGPVGTIANQRWYMVNQMETLIRTPGSLLIFAGVRRAL
jgi:hypothetical protein